MQSPQVFSPYERKTPAYRTNNAATEKITVGRSAPPQRSAPQSLLAAGDRVRHQTFGDGTVLSVTRMGADHLYEVAFDTKGTKKLMATYAKLQKI